MKPYISVIIRAYNNEAYIRDSITSALQQTAESYEIMLVNDGSTDKTKEIIGSFHDKRLRIIYQKNKGAIEAAYRGLKDAHGQLVTFLDGDDQLMPETLAELSKPLISSDDGFSYCDYWEIDRKKNQKKIVSLQNFFNHLLGGIMFRKSALDDIGFLDKSFLLPEYDLLMRLKKKYKGFHVAKPLYIYNRHAGSMTANSDFVEKAKKQIFDKYGIIEDFKVY